MTPVYFRGITVGICIPGSGTAFLDVHAAVYKLFNLGTFYYLLLTIG